ncbi:hypothetical protein SEVIR_9G325400v4 [Setaria viridis]|uniref:Uncharacterized protein n=2 Tax=Setaria TaxID=4554 RepID=A0A368SMW7_SETIT|nr:hypothetical protein SETIT_9G319700v2 [Setaria italica]TKV94891.1 hypothetical protein SEVIR_9G325400v2 [Setaria viridis]
MPPFSCSPGGKFLQQPWPPPIVIVKDERHEFELKSQSEIDGQMAQIRTWEGMNSVSLTHDRLFLLELDDNKEIVQAAMLLMSPWPPRRCEMVLLHLCASCLSVWPPAQQTVLSKGVELCLMPWSLFSYHCAKSHMEKSWIRSLLAISMHILETTRIRAWMVWCFHSEQISVIYLLSCSDGKLGRGFLNWLLELFENAIRSRVYSKECWQSMLFVRCDNCKYNECKCACTTTTSSIICRGEELVIVTGNVLWEITLWLSLQGDTNAVYENWYSGWVKISFEDMHRTSSYLVVRK